MLKNQSTLILSVIALMLAGCRAPKVIDTVTNFAAPKAVNGYYGKLFLGIGAKSVKLKNEYKGKDWPYAYGREVIRVCGDAGGDKAGFRLGDIIKSLNGKGWKTTKTKFHRPLKDHYGNKKPGDIIEAEIFRLSADKKTYIPISLKFRLSSYPYTYPEIPRSPTNEQLRPDLISYKADYQILCEKIIKESGKETDYKDLLMRLERSEEYPDPLRLDIERYVRRNPFKLEKISKEIIDYFSSSKARSADDIDIFLKGTQKYLLNFANNNKGKVLTAKVDDSKNYKGKKLKAHLDYIEATLKKAAAYHKQAFAKLSKEEIKGTLENRHLMLNAYLSLRMLSYDDKYDEQKKYLKILEVAGKIDYHALFKQSQVLSNLASLEFTDSLLQAAKKSKKNLYAATIALRNTPYGKILIAGCSRNRHTGDFAVIFELGGNDVYCGNNAGTVWKNAVCKIPSALIVDYAGDDAYQSTEDFSIAGGNLGSAILVDKKGDDSYVGRRFVQGTGFMGIGVLVDEKGNDIYRALTFSQGLGHFGVGILIDSDGNNRFEAHDTSQGVGLPGGCGILFSGGNGDDSYYCKGDRHSSYGNRGIFNGWGQGVGIGYRPYASGGLGILMDCAGRDRFEAGNFCQGGGYYYGFGLFYNGGKDNDKYIGSRYSQGFACHQAAGAFIEAGGDDFYSNCFVSVAQGLTWDESAVLFIDEAGNDRYEGGGFSQGAAAMNGFTIFIDRAGKDSYLYAKQASATSNNYHGGTSLSLFMDLGGDKDIFHKSRENNSIILAKQHSYFLDIPDSIKEIMKNDRWKKLIHKK